MKHWTVRSEIRRNGPVYFVQDQEGNAMSGDFDCERSAQILADYLNKKEEVDDGHKSS